MKAIFASVRVAFAGIRKSRHAVTVGVSIVLALLFMFVGLVKYETSINSIAVDVSVGMSNNDVQRRFGKPYAIVAHGNPLVPPHSSGFVPDIDGWQYSYTYWKYGRVVYIFFDDGDRVMAVYVCTV